MIHVNWATSPVLIVNATCRDAEELIKKDFNLSPKLNFYFASWNLSCWHNRQRSNFYVTWYRDFLLPSQTWEIQGWLLMRFIWQKNCPRWIGPTRILGNLPIGPSLACVNRELEELRRRTRKKASVSNSHSVFCGRRVVAEMKEKGFL